ncbi:MAG: hypothetical protein JNL01_03860 [Bdellovibrionales bacterium]|nr:hypothetical protein [Bdellovibrionales bacterium]
MKTWIITCIATIAWFAQPAKAAVSEWTILVYWAVDNDLYQFSIPYLEEFNRLNLKTTEKINIVVQYDHASPRRTERQVLNHLGHRGFSVVEVLGSNLNSASPKTFSDFLNWGVSQFPAKKYALVVGSHGSNWSGLIEDAPMNEYMTLENFASALRSGPKMDLLLFDTCNMSFLETLHVLKGTAPIMVGSNYFLNGLDHVHPIRWLSRNLNASPEEFAKRYVRSYPWTKGNFKEKDFALSALRLTETQSFVAELESFFAEISLQSDANKIRLYQRLKKSFDTEDAETAFDLFELIRVAGRLSDPLKKKARLLEQQNSWVIATGHTFRTKPHSGVSITCSMNQREYSKIGLGKIAQAWNALCSFWNQEFPVQKTAKP